MTDKIMIECKTLEQVLVTLRDTNARLDLQRAIEAAQPVEPVAWVDDLTRPQPHCVTDLGYMSAYDVAAGVKYQPLYAAPPAPAAQQPTAALVPLTDEQIIAIANSIDDDACDQSQTTAFARAIERAHGIGDKP